MIDKGSSAAAVAVRQKKSYWNRRNKGMKKVCLWVKESQVEKLREIAKNMDEKLYFKES